LIFGQIAVIAGNGLANTPRLPMITATISYQHVPSSMRRLRAELPGVAARVLTEFARVGVAATQRAMPQAFDRPTPFTVDTVRFKAAERKDQSPTSAVYIPKSNEDRGLPTSEYMRPGVLGAGRRNQKRSEAMLTRRGILPSGWALLPGSFTSKRKDAYGNVPGSYYKEIIQALQLRNPGEKYFKGISKASKRRAAIMGVGREFFAVSSSGQGIAPGIYKRDYKKNGAPLQYFVFRPAPSYRKRLDMPQVVLAAVQAKAPAVWQSIMRDVATRVIEKAGRGA
jgi:hypothetical protein